MKSEVEDYSNTSHPTTCTQEILSLEALFQLKYADTVLEIGCSNKPIAKAYDHLNYTGIDISLEAINLSKLKLEGEHKKFCVVDVLNTLDKPDLGSYSLIIDSHLLHCLVQKEERQKYYKFIKNHIKTGGEFVGEVLSYHEKVRIPFDFTLSETGVSTLKGKGYRKLFIFEELEKEFLENGFKINKLIHRKDLYISLFPLDNFSEPESPNIIQFSLSCI